MARDDATFNKALDFNRELAKRGWMSPAWPKEYGGCYATIAEQMVFNEEFGYFGAPDTGTRGFGVGMIGPTLIVHGNPEQKARYLPRITSGEDIWCQGYSEPGAGAAAVDAHDDVARRHVLAKDHAVKWREIPTHMPTRSTPPPG